MSNSGLLAKKLFITQFCFRGIRSELIIRVFLVGHSIVHFNERSQQMLQKILSIVCLIIAASTSVIKVII